MVKITIEIDNGTEPPRVIEINEKGTVIITRKLSAEERKKRIKEFLEWTETNRVKIDGPIEIPSREERNAR
jgi:effector-binding domain-containing protein